MNAFRLFLNHDLFFSFENEHLICWNYRTQEQFEITSDYFERLRQIGTGTEYYRDDTIDRELLDGELIGREKSERPGKWNRIAHIFHVGTQNILRPGKKLSGKPKDEAYLDYCNLLMQDPPPVIEKRPCAPIPLPAPQAARLEGSSLLEILTSRKTSRDFEVKSIDLESVATVLYYTFGALHGATRDDIEKLGARGYAYRRSSSSAGGLQSVEPYLLNLSVEQLEPGTYHYHSVEHALYPVAPKEAISAENLGGLLSGQYYAGNLAFCVFLAIRFDKLWWKYPYSRAYRAGLLDTGHLSQTFQLVCTALSLNTWLTGYFYDPAVNERLGLDSEHESCVLTLGAGFGPGQPMPRSKQEVVRKRRAANSVSQS
jgi:SagB-type dehydrogenase family enzyme